MIINLKTANGLTVRRRCSAAPGPNNLRTTITPMFAFGT